MQDLELEETLAVLDRPGQTPPDIAERIRSRAVTAARGRRRLVGASGDEMDELAVLGDPDRPNNRSWPRTRVLVTAAAVLGLAALGYVALRPANLEVVTAALPSPGIEEACRQLSSKSEEFVLFEPGERPLSEEEIADLRMATRTLLAEAAKADVVLDDVSSFELELGQALRDYRTGNPQAGERLIAQARLTFSGLVAGAAASMEACYAP